MTVWHKFGICIGLVLLAGCASSSLSGPSGDPGVQRAISEQDTKTKLDAKARVHAELGTEYYEAGRYGTALDEAKVAIAYDKNYAPGHLLMAKVYSALDQQNLARAAFEEAASLAPGDPEIGTAYGWYQCNYGQEQEGLQRLERAARNPYYRTPARAYTNAGLCSLRMKNDAGAEAQFLKAVQIDGGSNRVLYQLSEIALRMGNTARAREWLLVLQKRMPTQTAEVVWLGLRIERKAGDLKAEALYVDKLRTSFASSDEYQAFIQGRFE